MTLNWWLYFFVRGPRTPLSEFKMNPFRGHRGSKIWNDKYNRKDSDPGEYLWDDDQEIEE